MQHITAIGFDLFDTLITVQNLGLADAMERLVRCLHAEGFAVESATFMPVYRETARGFMHAARQDGRETHNRFWVSEALQRVGIDVTPDDPRIHRTIEAYFSAFLDHASLLPGTLEMLQTLQGRYRLGLLSNFTHPPVVAQILSQFGLDAYLDVQLVSGTLGYRKPHANVFDALVQHFEVPATQIAFVGDDVHADVHGAKQAGMQPIWTTYAQAYKAQQQPDKAAGRKDNPDPPVWMAEASATATATNHVPTITSWDDLLTLLNGQ
jgi:putative hydrolase of the HAD superfamily